MQKIKIDFDNPGLPQHISAVENDSQSRFFQATLYENGKAYTAPEGATYSIMYRGFGPQNQGWYDTINDGAGKRAACAVSGNVVTCEIARQALQVPGHVSIVLCVTTGKGYMLKSWPIECDCKNDRYDSTVEIQSFFYITQVSNADWTQAIQAWENLKDTIDPTLSVSGKAADAAKVGEAVGQVKEDVKYVNEKVNIPCIVEIGGFNNTVVGSYSERNDRLRVHQPLLVSDIKKITVDVTKLGLPSGTNRLYNVYFDSDKKFVTSTSKIISAGEISVDTAYSYVEFVFANTSVSDFTGYDLDKFIFNAQTNLNYYTAKEIANDALSLASKLNGDLKECPIWQQGTVSTTGALADNTTRIRTDYIDVSKVVSFEVASTRYKIMVSQFDSEKAWIQNNSWSSNNNISFDNYNCAYVIIVLRIGDGTMSLSPDDLTETNFIITKITDTKTLEKQITNASKKLDSEVESRKETDIYAIGGETTGSLNQISRLGWLPYTGKYPQQSLLSYAEAYRNGCRIMLCDVRITSDGKYVCWHDDDISKYAKTSEGDSIPSVLISESTLSELQTYDFGIYKGAAFTGTKILTLSEFLSWCAMTNCVPMLETKVGLSSSQVGEVASLVKRCGLGYNCIIADDESYLIDNVNAWLTKLPNAQFCVRGGTRNAENAHTQAMKFIENGNRTSISITSTSTFDSYGQKWIADNIEMEYSEVKSETELSALIEGDYIPGITYIASSYVNINKYMCNKYNLMH